MNFWRLVVSVKAYQIIKTFLLFFSFWRMEEVSVIQHSCWVYNLLPLLIFEERFIASCGNTEYSKGTHWLLDPCLPSIFIDTLLSFLPKSDCCWLLPTAWSVIWSQTTLCFAPVVCVEIVLSCWSSCILSLFYQRFDLHEEEFVSIHHNMMEPTIKYLDVSLARHDICNVFGDICFELLVQTNP